jgi:hypothetical protein
MSFLLSPDNLMHVLVVALSLTVLGIALLAYERKRNMRFLLLSLAFFFIAIGEIVTFFETFFLSGALIMIPIVNIHLAHIFDFFTLVTFGLALMRDWGPKKPEVVKVASR